MKRFLEDAKLLARMNRPNFGAWRVAESVGSDILTKNATLARVEEA